jgi:hypothetical protein
MSHARELLSLCKPHIEAFPLRGDDLQITRLRIGLTKAVKDRKREMASASLGAEFGISYEELLAFSQAHPDDPRWNDAWQKVRMMSFGAELIISAFTDDEVAILTVESDGTVTWTEHYAAVGTGSAIANAYLQQRPYYDSMDVSECLYRVMEAKTAAERNPHVGKSTNLEARRAEGAYMLSFEFEQQIRKLIEEKRTLPELPEITGHDICGTIKVTQAETK